MWTVFIQEELANMTELADWEKNLMLLVCLNEEIKESENIEFEKVNTTERCHLCQGTEASSLKQLQNLLYCNHKKAFLKSVENL